jgi:phosphatidylserine/phosphatidylglycerophosphate/cardiolipin synthase-like enzyme
MGGMMSKDLATAFCEAQSRAERAEARVAELEAELSHSILDATALLVDGKAKAEARVAELEAALEKIEYVSHMVNMDGLPADDIDQDEWWHIARAALGKDGA